MKNSIILDKLGDKIKVDILRSNKAKRISIRVKHQQVELILPNEDLDAACDFLLSKEHWIRKKITASLAPVKTREDEVLIFGKNHFVKLQDSSRDKVKIKDDVIYVNSAAENSQQLLLEFLQDLLLLEIYSITEEISRQKGWRFSQIKLIQAKTVWGRCCAKKILAFNWRLIFAPKDVIYYVVAHEMCHLIHMNHSQNFWQLVENICADYKKHKLWLKENSARLHQYL